MRALSALILVVLGLELGCAEPLDTTRQTAPRGTLGEEIYRVLHRDLEREAPERAFGFESERAAFIGAIDHMMPESELERTQALLVSLLPLHDDDTLARQTRTLAELMDRLAGDPEASAALAALQNRVGYVDLARQEALVRRFAAYPRFRELSRRLLGFALAHDGRDEAGARDPRESDLFLRAVDYAATRLAQLEITRDDERSLVLAANLMLTEDPRLATATLPEAPQVVARDPRGMALVEPPALDELDLFKDDTPADGLPDVDGAGRFLAPNGAVVELPPFARTGPRDEHARATSRAGLVYRYVELDQTLLAAGLRDGRHLIEREALPKARRVLDAVLGARTEDGTFNPANNPLLDLVHALQSGVTPEDVLPLVSVARGLLLQHEGSLAYLLEELERQSDIAAAHPQTLRPGNDFLTDLLSVARRILEQPGLMEALLQLVEEDPDLLLFPRASAELMAYKRLPVTEEDFDQGRVFVEAVDWTRPDDRQNQSFHQRVLHLIYDTRGLRYRPEFLNVPLGFIFEIPDLAEFYLLSLIGEAEVPSLVSALTGLSSKPSPAELARFINQDQTFGNPVGREGVEVRHNDGDVLFAVAASDMGRALAPLVRLFWSRGQLNLLLDVFEFMHLHYATVAGGDYQDADRRQPRYSKLSGIRDLEPMLIEIYRGVALLESTRHLLLETRGLTATGGAAARDVLLRTARRFLAKDSSLRTRAGALDVVVEERRVSPLSPFELVWWALERMDTAVSRSPATRAAADELDQLLFELYLETEGSGPARRLANRKVVVMGEHLLGFLEDRIQTHRARGRLASWWTQDLAAELESAVRSPALPLLLDLWDALRAEPELEAMVLELRAQLLADADGFPELLALAGDLLGEAKDAGIVAPVLRFLGRELAVDRGLALELVDFTNRALDFDPEQQLLELARRGLEPARPEGIQLYGLGRALRETNRVRPGAQALLSAEDTQLILRTISNYLLDDEHGLEKFYRLVKDRDAARGELAE